MAVLIKNKSLLYCGGVGLLLVLAAGACTPDIARNTYFCGRDSLCPPGLECQVGDNNRFSYSCALPGEILSFSCPSITSDHEPDDTSNLARRLGDISCGQQRQFDEWGCIESKMDVDRFQFDRPSQCEGRAPRVRITLRFPVGTAPLMLELLDDNEGVIATASLCEGEQDRGGSEQICIDYLDAPAGSYEVRISQDSEARADCDGACQFNRYQLVLSSPVS